jgi:4-hydroxybenzoate polyprenyltransferase
MHERRQKLVTFAKKCAAHALEFSQAGWRIICRVSVAGWRRFLILARAAGVVLGKYSITAWTFLCRTGITGWRIAENFLRRIFIYLRSQWPSIRDRLVQYALLIRLDKPIGIFLLLWPTLWALWFAAEGVPDISILITFVLGVVCMRSAGCVINDLADRDIDPYVTRTRNRPLAAGKVSVREALIIALVLVFCAFLLVLQLNPLTVKLSFAGAALAILYPFTKRYTYIPQFFLGLAFGWAVPMAFAAQTGTLPVIAWILLMATVLWAVVYDTMYAMVDRADDLRMGVKSTAILFEDADRAIIGVIQVLVLLALVLTGGRMEAGWMYYAGLGVAGCFSLYQQYLIKDRIPEQCFRAFLNNHWFGATVFAGIFFNYYLG